MGDHLLRKQSGKEENDGADRKERLGTKGELYNTYAKGQRA